MLKKEILILAEKYRKLAYSGKIFDEELVARYERFADFIEENDYLEDPCYESEQDLLDHFKEVEEEHDYQWSSMFPNDDDSN